MSAPSSRPKARVAPQRSHATKRAPTPTAAKAAAAAAKAPPSDKITIDQLAKLFGLPDWDSVDERNQQHYWEMSRGAEGEDAQMEAEREAQEEVYRQWYDAVESTAEHLLGEHGLELLAMKHTRKVNQNYRPHVLKIIPSSGWQVGAGLRKVLASRDAVRRVFAQNGINWPETSFDFGSAVKQIHAAPAVITELVPKITRRDGSPPTSWNDLRQKVMSFPLAQMGDGLQRLWNAPSKRGLANRLEDTLRNAEFVGRVWGSAARTSAVAGRAWF
jgi:hypothetical protein